MNDVGTRLKFAVWVLAGGIAVASFTTTPPGSNDSGRPLMEGANVPTNVAATFERACQDCHSDRTRFPWYCYVAPVSWLVRHDVVGGRERLNMSRWSDYSLVRKQRLLSEIANQVEDRDMPLWQYTIVHRGARLTDGEIAMILRWTQTERLRLIMER